MLTPLRRGCSLIVHLVTCFSRFVARLLTKNTKVEPEGNPGVDQRWDNDSEWEPFSIKVVPNADDIVGTSPSKAGDLFADMEPVFKKAKKIIQVVTRHEQVSSSIDKHKFAVQDTGAYQQEAGLCSELGVWNEESEGSGWEDQLDDGQLVSDSAQILKAKRRQEREARKIAQETLRAQQRIGGQQHTLGTKLS